MVPRNPIGSCVQGVVRSGQFGISTVNCRTANCKLPNVDSLSPIRRQYLDVKRRYPHAIVFFRLGDFYETFDDDAELCARELEITLTSKPMGKGLRVPLAGIPYHAVDGYIAKLIAKGYKVALCEQMSDPATTKGIVDRKVVRVVTPGTVIEDNLLDERANNYLACLAPARRRRAAATTRGRATSGFAYVDISTGEFVAGALTQRAGGGGAGAHPPGGGAAAGGRRAAAVARCGDARHARRAALVRPRPGDGDACRSTSASPRPRRSASTRRRPRCAACGAVLMYLRENQAASVALVTALRAHRAGEYVGLDAHTMRNLELFTAGRDLRREGSLLATLDLTSTSMGARLLRRRLGQPLVRHRRDRARGSTPSRTATRARCGARA